MTFFYQPYITAENYVDSHTSMENLGYWSKPFILEDFYMDNHKMITYSVPLVYDKIVYGVLGIEVGVNDLAKYFPVKDLDSNLNAGFALVVDHGNGNYEGIAGEGALYDAVSGMEETLFWRSRSRVLCGWHKEPLLGNRRFTDL